MADDGNELPGYTRRPSVTLPAAVGARRSEHKYSLETGKGRPWLFLFVQSRSPSPASAPFFLEADTITGRVELDIDKPEAVKSISVALQAGTTAVGQEEQIFLDLNQPLWPEGNEKASGKIGKGKHSWPFTFTLPPKVSLADVTAKGLPIALPPTFSERASPAYVDYRIVTTIKRGAFKANQTLQTNFAYLPLIQPEPPSALRQLAYREGSDLVGPSGDPAGWKVLQPVTLRGKLFDAKEVSLECSLAIATPLAFTIGSPIPLTLTIKCDDEQALDTVANPLAIQLHLVRSVALGSDSMEERIERRSNTFFLSGAGQAFFWPSTEGAPEKGSRTLMGELDVKKTVKPSFLFPRFSVRYTLDLLPFAITGFTPLGVAPGTSLFSEPVKITTKHVPGVTPRSYAPPGYERPPEGDYNSAVGYLENGNQRFCKTNKSTFC
ncbi:hypothetical protein C8J57DRAFT_1498005 [Mycena rebaudengoi]|nr:hypothetical protein C8J57DRAFT_1498005 [Mycena rebaudengoi]